MSADAPPLLDRIHALLDAEASAAHWSILIDPTMHDPLEALSLPLEHSLTVRRLPITRWPESARPYLLAATSTRDAERLLSLSIELAYNEMRDGRARSLCAWLHTGADVDALESTARHLAKAMLTRREGAGKSFMFRFYDPRLCADSARILGAAGWSALAGPLCDKWWTPHPQQGAVKAGGQPSGAPLRPLPLSLSSNEYRELTALGWVNRVLSTLPAWQLAAPPSTQLVRQVVNSAQAEGCDNDLELLAFAYASFAHHPDFHRHPLIQRARTEEQTPYATIVEQLSDDEWARIRGWANAQEHSPA